MTSSPDPSTIAAYVAQLATELTELRGEVAILSRDNERLEAELEEEAAESARLSDMLKRSASIAHPPPACGFCAGSGAIGYAKQAGWDYEAEADGSRIQLLTDAHPHGGVVVTWPDTYRCWLVCDGRIHSGPRLSRGEEVAVLTAAAGFQR